MTVARLTAKKPLVASPCQYSGKGVDWPSVRVCLARDYISADFCRLQRDKLRELTQRSRESIQVSLKMYETLLNEAYEEVPQDQSELIRVLLSGLEDEQMAQQIAAQELGTIKEAVADILKNVSRGDFLRSPQC